MSLRKVYENGYNLFHPEFNAEDVCRLKIDGIYYDTWMKGWHDAELDHLNKKQVQENKRQEEKIACLT